MSDSAPVPARLSPDLFPDGEFRFHLTLRRAVPREFLEPCDRTGGVLAERARWLDLEPQRHAALRPEGEAPLQEFAALCREWKVGAGAIASGAGATRLLQALGRTLEPDLLFLSPDHDGRFRLRGGALCFPTGWALEEKLGQTIETIHGIVPGLNAALGRSIDQFLSKLKPGVAFLRDNWGVAASDESNLHPARHVAPPAPPVSLDRLWLRVEHQALIALPESRGIFFGIRIALHRLDAVAHDPVAPRLRRALETLPDALARYKKVDTVRAELVRLLPA